jgi:hypothetical protein
MRLAPASFFQQHTYPLHSMCRFPFFLSVRIYPSRPTEAKYGGRLHGDLFHFATRRTALRGLTRGEGRASVQLLSPVGAYFSVSDT